MKKVLIFAIAMIISMQVFSSEDSKKESLSVEFEASNECDTLIDDTISTSKGVMSYPFYVANKVANESLNHIEKGRSSVEIVAGVAGFVTSPCVIVGVISIPLYFYGMSSYVACLVAKSTMNNKTLDHDRNLVFNTTQAIISEANF